MEDVKIRTICIFKVTYTMRSECVQTGTRSSLVASPERLPRMGGIIDEFSPVEGQGGRGSLWLYGSQSLDECVAFSDWHTSQRNMSWDSGNRRGQRNSKNYKGCEASHCEDCCWYVLFLAGLFIRIARRCAQLKMSLSTSSRFACQNQGRGRTLDEPVYRSRTRYGRIPWRTQSDLVL